MCQVTWDIIQSIVLSICILTSYRFPKCFLPISKGNVFKKSKTSLMYVYQNRYLESTQKLCWFSKVAVIGSLLVLGFDHLQLIYSLQFTVHSLYYRFIGPVIHFLILSRLKVQLDNCWLLPRCKRLCSILRNILAFQSLCGLQVLQLGITIDCFFSLGSLNNSSPYYVS